MNIFGKIRSFIGNTVEEMKKSVWPSRDQLLESTLLVLVSLVILAGFVALVDWLLVTGIKYIISA